MKKSEIIKRVAPCSLMCHTCSAYNDGIICVSAKTLLKYLEGIKEFYEVHMPNAVESYNNFEGVLQLVYVGIRWYVKGWRENRGYVQGWKTCLRRSEVNKMSSIGSQQCVNKLLASFLIDTVTPRGVQDSKVIISIGRYRKCGEAWYFNEFEIQCFCVLTGSK